jgi:hypothetical protein
VASCAYQVGGANQVVSFNEKQNVQFDNFEGLGLCESASGAPYGHDTFITDGGIGYLLYSDIYIHGWTHLPWSCSNGSGFCFNMAQIRGNSTGSPTFQNLVIDGSDSDPAGSAADFNAIYDIHDSVIRYSGNLLGGDCHTLHDNLIEYSYEPGDGSAHGNVYECNGEASVGAPNTVYNNVIRHAPGIGVSIWPEPPVGATDYYFNNVIYDINTSGNYFNIGQNSNAGNQGSLVIFNNTFENPTNQAMLDGCGLSYAHPFTAANNYYITDNSSAYTANCASSGGGGTFVNEVLVSHAKAASQGFTASGTFAYVPTLATSPTVAAGTNEMSYCNALSGDPNAYAACQSETTYACTYNASNHTVSCPARPVLARPSSGKWDVGAFQFGSSSGTTLPATNVQATPH